MEQLTGPPLRARAYYSVVGEPSRPPSPPSPKRTFGYTPRPSYDENFLGHTNLKEYYYITSGPNDCGVPSFPGEGGRSVDYVHDILLLKEKGGFTVNGGPLRRFDDPANHQLMEALYFTKLPKEFISQDQDTGVKVHRVTIRRPKVYPEENPVVFFEPGTPQEILDAAADSPNSYLIRLDTHSDGKRYVLFKPRPCTKCNRRNGGSIQI